MKRRADKKVDPAEEREKLIGLGKRSISKSYYPELRSRLDELEHFRALLDRVSDAILIVDAETGSILDVSGATTAMLTCRPDDILGKEFKTILPPHVARYAANIVFNQSDTLNLETEFRCPCDACAPPVPVEVSIKTLKYQESRQAVVVARDISERKRNEEVLRKSHDELEIRVRERTREVERANRAKSEFLSIVSHELRTPLTSVIGFAKIIRKKLLETIFPAVDPSNSVAQKHMSQVEKNIDIIVSEGDRLTALINDVLDLAKLEEARGEYHMDTLDPAEFIDQSAGATSALFQESGLSLILNIDSNLPRIFGDKDRLVQVMVNLFSNSVKFTEKGSVTCRVRHVGDHIRVSVTDTGVGIPDDLADAIFEKFIQGQEALADRPKGTGLGLPICRRIIEGHGGYIWAAKGRARGGKIIFTLPVLRPDE